MDTSTRTLPDESFSIIQKKLRNWMRAKGFVTWKQIQKACRDLLEGYPKDYISQYGNFPEYKLFMPLLRKGKCEIAQQEGKIGFVCFPKSEYLENPVDPLLLLNNFPALSSLIEQFKIEDSIELKVWCDFEDSYSFKIINSKVEKIGIYKSEDKVYSPAFLYDGKEKRLIPSYDENIDALSISRCYVRAAEGKKMFFYHKKTKALSTTVYSDLPILITRVLFLLNKDNFKDDDFNYPINYKKLYKNINEKVIIELIRIFGKKCMEVLDD